MLLSSFPLPASWVLLLLVAALGLITGSFLNAVIHRLPRGISLLNPSRSFCPRCQKMIPWHENLPLASWVLLRGRCSGCALPISIRYPLVELLSAGLYLFAWHRFGLPLAVVYWIFLSLLEAATFIDFDHLIIPDEITLGGTVTGLSCATLLPNLLGASSWWQGFLLSLLGGAAGYCLLWGVVELGKKAFGQRRIHYKEPCAFEITSKHEGNIQERSIKLGGEELSLEEIFYRSSDRVEAGCEWIEISGERLGPGRLVLEQESMRYDGREWELSGISTIRAEVTDLMLPREAMGFGDVKFLACIGTFLGWKGVLFSLFAGSVAGAVVGLGLLIVTGGRSGGRIPFGPYLALGAGLWVFAGPELVSLYCMRLHGGVGEAFFLSPLHLPV